MGRGMKAAKTPANVPAETERLLKCKMLGSLTIGPKIFSHLFCMTVLGSGMYFLRNFFNSMRFFGGVYRVGCCLSYCLPCFLPGCHERCQLCINLCSKTRQNLC